MVIGTFSIWMTVLWSSILILIFYILRKKNILIDVCSVSGVIILYLFCMVRMVLPLEFTWTKIFSGGKVYRYLYVLISQEIGFNISIRHLLLVIWLIGAICFTCRHCIHYYKLRKLFHGLENCNDMKIKDIMQNLDNGGTTKVVRTSIIQIPCCFGIIHKMIVLPKNDYSEKDLYFILFHESSHLKNRDILTKVLINLLCAIYWWNPFVYLLKKDLNQSLEIRCDYTVANGLDKKLRADYLSAMLTVFKNSGSSNDLSKYNQSMMQLLEEHSERLIERFQLVARYKKRKRWLGNALAWFIAGIMLVASYSFSIHPHFEPSMSEIEIDENAHEVNQADDYIIKSMDGYYLHTEYGNIYLEEEKANKLVEEGFSIFEEGAK